MSRTVDIHQHVVPSVFSERVKVEGAKYGWKLATGRDGIDVLSSPDGSRIGLHPDITDENVRIDEMTASGIDISIQSIAPNLMYYDDDPALAEWTCHRMNDALASSRDRHPERLLSHATLPMQFPAMAVDELHRVAEEHEFKSAQIGTRVNQRSYDDPYFFEFWAAAEKLGTVIFVHPYHPVIGEWLPKYHLTNLIGNPLETTMAVANLIFGGVLERYPNLKFVFAHSGGYAPWIRGRWRHGMEIRPETRDSGATKAVDEYFKLLYFDTLIHDERAFSHLIDTVGAGHILMGTDYPADMGDWAQVARIRSMNSLSGAEADAILGGNALRLLGHKSLETNTGA